MGVAFTEKWLAAVPGTGSTTTYTDAKARGLQLRVSGDGAVKSWSVWYRLAGKAARLPLGRYPEVTLSEARARAVQTMAAVGRGEDPAAERKAKAAEVSTVADLVADYLARGTDGERGIVEKRRRLDVHVLPHLGAIRLRDLHRRDVARVLDALKVPRTEKRKKAVGKAIGVRVGGPAIASRVFDDLRAMTAWATGAGIFDADPLAALPRPSQSTARDRVLSHDEVRAVLTGLHTAPLTADMRRALRLLFLTACRASEIAELRWSEIDFNARVVRLPAERVKNARAFTIPLSPAALGLLREQLAELEADEARRAKRYGRPALPLGDEVFPARRGEGSIEGHALSVAVRRNVEHFGVARFSPHDIRRTMATLMADDLGVEPHIVEVALNHVSGFRRGVAGTYNRASYERPHRDALERLASHLEAIEAGRSNVVSMNAGAR